MWEKLMRTHILRAIAVMNGVGVCVCVRDEVKLTERLNSDS